MHHVRLFALGLCCVVLNCRAADDIPERILIEVPQTLSANAETIMARLAFKAAESTTPPPAAVDALLHAEPCVVARRCLAAGS